MERNLSGLKTRSHVSVTTRSGASSTSAAAARAKAEAAKACLMYTEKEVRMRIEKAQLEASMEMLAIEKEIAVAEAKVAVLEAVIATNEERHSCKLPFISSPCDSAQRPQDYVKEQAKICEERGLAQEEDPAFKTRQRVYTQSHLRSSLYTTPVSILKALSPLLLMLIFRILPLTLQVNISLRTPFSLQTWITLWLRAAILHTLTFALTFMVCSPFMPLIPT